MATPPTPSGNTNTIPYVIIGVAVAAAIATLL